MPGIFDTGIYDTGIYDHDSSAVSGVTSRRDAGGSVSARKRGRPRKPILVEIDGEQFVVSSKDEAAELLFRAKEAAEENAKAQALAIVEKRKAKAAKDGRLNINPLRLDGPGISVSPAQKGYIDKAWLAEFDKELNGVILSAYEQAARDAEMQLLFVHQAMVVDEEDALVALLLTM